MARYDAPLRRLLALRYGRLLTLERREDLAQEILIEIKQRLAPRFDRERGRFRALLQTVVQRRVTDELRRARPLPLSEAAAAELEAPSLGQLEALDLEASLVRAVEVCRDTFSGGARKDLDLLHVLIDRVVHGASATEIARRAGVSRDRVKRQLAKARAEIFRALLADELALSGPSLEEHVSAFTRSLRRPSDFERHLGALGGEAEQEAFRTFWARFRAALPHFEGDESEAGRELAAGIALLLDPS